MDDNCIFCNIANGKGKSNIIHEDENTVAFLDIFPVSDYHTLVIPRRHYKDIFDIPENELIHVMQAIKQVTKKYQEILGIENVQIINSSGEEAQQDVFHIHFHIVPRSKSDGQDIVWETEELTKEKAISLLKKLNE